jgi:farnesyl-diphosphate farnesyltransferase
MSPATSTEILQKVSRSFALCIPLLEENKIREVENMYILSRVVDTIEDSSLDKDEKKELMELFFETLNGEGVDSFVHRLGRGIIDDHDIILTIKDNYEAVLDIFRSLDEPVRDISITLLREMSSGMVKYLYKPILNFNDLDEYCYYVAGTVGLYMNRMVELLDGVKLDEEKAVVLGRYLQKINIIKNFYKDALEGRKFWPHIEGDKMEMLEKMIENAKSEADASFDYIASVPYELAGYRKFLILSTFMATENLKLMKDNPAVFSDPNGVKIPRSRMAEIFVMTAEASESNESLWRFKKEIE